MLLLGLYKESNMIRFNSVLWVLVVLYIVIYYFLHYSYVNAGLHNWWSPASSFFLHLHLQQLWAWSEDNWIEVIIIRISFLLALSQNELNANWIKLILFIPLTLWIVKPESLIPRLCSILIQLIYFNFM